jgi:hypothetical protein
MRDPLDIVCAQCGYHNKQDGIERHMRNLAMPEYLRVHVDFLEYRRHKNGEIKLDKHKDPILYKNRTALQIPEELDLTHLMTLTGPDPFPVRYRLQHVVYHQGTSLTGGHYAAAVTGVPEQEGAENTHPYFCNDGRVDEIREPDILTSNPLRKDYDPSLLWYVRVEREKSGEKAVRGKREIEVDVNEVDDQKSVADRLMANPRKRVKRVL